MAIKRPEAPQLDAIFATVDKIHRAEKRLAALREQVAQEARALAEITDKRLRIEAGFYAYWFAPDVPSKDIALGATGRPHPAKLMRLAGPVTVGVPCDRCGEELPIRSRSQMKEVLDQAGTGPSSMLRYKLVCIPCQNELDEESFRRREAEYVSWEARRRDVAGLPYAEYLQTGEWEDACDRHLWWRGDQTGALDCETCGSSDRLGLYHKSLDGLGTADELTLLCTECRDALIAGGKLAGPPSAGNLVPPERIASITEALRAELSY